MSLVGIGTPPTPLPQASVPFPPDQRVGGQTSLRLRGRGSPNSDDWRKSLALCLLCGWWQTDYLPASRIWFGKHKE